ncbi:MAG: MOSC domain-containing protein [Gammaproteobacteria bacterium]|nr:MOSC domain-containing protein [Gammaproteobacteria bacterium]
MTIPNAKVLSVNVGTPREFEYKNRNAKSAIWKSPVTGRIAARGVNLDGDDQADRVAHGGYNKAVYAYAIEDIAWWEQQVGQTIHYGVFGENVTTHGISVNEALVGERWEVGTTILEVSEPRIPCWRLGVRMEDKTFPRQFTQALRPGSYLRIIVEGDIGANDEINVIAKPDHDLSVRDVFRIFTHNREEFARILEVEQMSADWKRWATDEKQKIEKRLNKEVAGPGCC